MSDECMTLFTVFEVLCNLVSVCGVIALIARNRQAEQRADLLVLCMMFLCMSASNIQWCLQILSDAPPAPWFYGLGKVCAPLDYAFFAAYLWRRFFVGQKWSAAAWASVILPCVCCFVAIVSYTVVPFQAQSDVGSFSRAINLIIWPLAAFLMSLLLRFSQQTLKVADTVFLLSMMLILTSALAGEYRLMTVGYSSASWDQIGWAAGFAGLAWSVLRDLFGKDPVLHRPAEISEWFSLRALMGVSVFSSNIALLVALRWAGLLSIDNGRDLTCALLLGYASWCVSIFLAIFLSRKIREIRACMAVPEEPSVASARAPLQAVAGQTRLTEVDGIIDGYNERVAHINALNLVINEKDKQAALGRAATQVAHDIRSPLAALKMVLPYLSGVEEDIRVLLRDAVHRVEDIANDLLEHHRNNKKMSEDCQQVLVSAVVEQLISHLRLQHRSRLGLTIQCDFSHDAHFLCAKAPAGNFKRVISNLVNNAAEAIGDAGMISVVVRRKSECILIDIRDNGKGIPPEILARLGEEGVSSGKTHGNGLGVFQARQELAAWAGKLTYDSTVGRGTTASISLPIAQPPVWLQTYLTIGHQQRVVVLDDDVSIHRVWRERFAGQVCLTSCSTFADLRDIVGASTGDQDVLYLIDHELTGSDMNGLEAIEHLQLKAAVLVTSNYDDQRVLSACQRAEIKIIPKFLASRIPIDMQARPARRAAAG